MLLRIKRRNTRIKICVDPRLKASIRRIRKEALTAKAVIGATTPEEDKELSQVGRVLDSNHYDPAKQLNIGEVVTRIITLAQALKERKFYPYQIEIAARVIESLLMRDSNVITALLARQMGKTEVIGSVVAALMIILPQLANQFEDSWHLNITDDNGVYRGFSLGVKVGIYAPRQDQAAIMFERVKQSLETDTAKRILGELKLTVEVSNGNCVKLSNGSRVLCQSASEQSKIEGETHHLLIAEEAQDITDLKMKKSLHPMVSATGGTIVKVGTATTQKCDFYTAIKTNERAFHRTGIRNNFFFPYTVGIKYNSLYKQVVEQEAYRIGEDSDEFRTSYCCEWIFERGMFVTLEQLFNRKVAQDLSFWCSRHPTGLPKSTHGYYSVVAGIDWGQAYDSTVVTLVAVDWNNPLEENETYNSFGHFQYSYFQKHVIDWLEFHGDDYEYQFGTIVEYLNQVPGLRKIVTDSNGGGRPIYDRLVATFATKNVEVEDFNFNAKIKSDGYKSLFGDICAKRITVPAGAGVRRTREYRKFTDQMLDLKKSYKGGLMKVEHPDEKDAHDDYPDSLMLAAWGARIRGVNSVIDYMDVNPFYTK